MPNPNDSNGVQDLKTKGMKMTLKKVTPSAHLSLVNSSKGGALRHLAIGPIPMRKRAGAIKGIKTESK
jgi:uncharacterized Zn ribbon protein